MTHQQAHVIGTQAIHLNTSNRRTARALMERASGLWAMELAPIAEAVFSAHSSADIGWRIERLELTLGTIAEEDFATELPRRFRAALEAELRRQRVLAASGERGRPWHGDTSLLEMLEHVLLRGYVPWWARAERGFDPVRQFVDLLGREPARIAVLARKIGRYRRVRVRLVHWLDDPHLARLIRAIAGGDAEFVLRYAADLDARQEEQRIIVATRDEFRRAKWEVILAHLLADRGSRFNAKAFLRGTLRELAAYFRLNYVELLRELLEVAQNMATLWREASLPQLLAELWREDVVQAPVNTIEASSGADTPVREAAQFLALVLSEEEPGLPIDQRNTFHDRWRVLSDAQRRELVAAAGSARGYDHLVAHAAKVGDAVIGAEIAALSRTAAHARAALEDVTRVWHEIASGVVRPLTADEEQAWDAWQALPEEWKRCVPVPVSTVPDVAARAEAIGAENGTDTCDDAHVMPALRRLLETGALPSAPWALQWHARLDAWLEWVLVRYAEAVPPLLRAWARGTRLTTTMPEHFEDDALESVVAVIEPAHGDEISAFVRTVRRGEPPLAGAEPRGEAFRRATWTVVLDYLLSDRGSVFNQRSFLEYSVEQLAARQRLEVDAVLEYLVAASAADSRHELLRDLQTIAERRRRAREQSVASAALSSDPEQATRTSLRDSRTTEEQRLRRDDAQITESLKRAPDAEESEAARSAKMESLVDESVAGEKWEAAFLRWLDRPTSGRIAALRCLYLVLTHGAALRSRRIEARLAALWPRLLAPALWPCARELVRRGPLPSRFVVAHLLAHGAETWFAELVFHGDKAQHETWRRMLDACAKHPGLARRLGDAKFKAGAWHALLEHWRRRGGRTTRELAAWFAGWLARSVPISAATLASFFTSGMREPLRVDDRAVDETPTGATEETDESDPKGAIVDEPIAIANAGLVMLAPFLPELHRRCGLLEAGRFKNFAANQTAVHLVQFLVAGGQRTHEYSLVLNKILCGLDPAAAVVPHVELEPLLVSHANALLENVARQWPRGAKISVDGLRGTYLARAGRLKRGERGAWTLKVEAKGWDVLLAELPWSFGRIQPAWMPAPLVVDWI